MIVAELHAKIMSHHGYVIQPAVGFRVVQSRYGMLQRMTSSPSYADCCDLSESKPVPPPPEERAGDNPIRASRPPKVRSPTAVRHPAPDRTALQPPKAKRR
jgi:hypothetical protein